MSEAGYTLAETLTALTMIGLAMGGVALGMQVIGRQQLSASQTLAAGQASRTLQVRLEDLFRRGEPYRAHEADRFVGGQAGFSFACGGAEACEAKLEAAEWGFKLSIKDHAGAVREARLAGAGAPHFVYQGSATTSMTWPPATPERQALRAVSLVAHTKAGDVALLAVRLSAEQPRRCDYDAILKDCR